MRGIGVRVLCAVSMISVGLAVPLAGTASAADISKPVSANAPAVKLTFVNTGDNAALSFSGLSNQVVKVTTSAGTYAANCDVMVSVLKGTTSIAGPVCGGIAGTTGDIVLPSNATYTIAVDTQGHAPATVKVALTSTGAIRSITPNAAPVTFSVPASSTTDFGFIAKAGQRLSALTADGTFGVACQVRLSIIAPDHTTVVGTTTCAGQAGFIDAVDSLGAGAYYLRVINTAAPTGTLKLQVFQFKDKTAAISANGAAVTTKLSSPGQHTDLTFAGANGQKISYKITASTLVGQVLLYKPDGTYGGTYTSASTNSFADSFTLTVTGTWTLKVDGSGYNTGSVTVQLYTFTDQSDSITPGGASKTVTISTPGQNGHLTFSGTTGNSRSFQVTASTLTGQVSLIKPDGTYGGTYTCLTAGCTAGPITLTVTGTWSLFVDPSGTATGSATIKLT